jgi:hypothetical protein
VGHRLASGDEELDEEQSLEIEISRELPHVARTFLYALRLRDPISAKRGFTSKDSF